MRIISVGAAIQALFTSNVNKELCILYDTVMDHISIHTHT